MVGRPATESTRKRMSRIQLLEDFICDLTLFPGRYSPTMNSPTTALSGRSSPNCKDKTRWSSSSAGEASALKRAGRLKGWFNSIVRSKLAIAAWLQSAPTTSLIRMSIAVNKALTAHSSSACGGAIYMNHALAQHTDPAHFPGGPLGFV